MHPFLLGVVVVALALQERRGDRADADAAPVELAAEPLQRVGAVVDDLEAVDRAQLDGPDPELPADVERAAEIRVDLVA